MVDKGRNGSRFHWCQRVRVKIDINTLEECDVDGENILNQEIRGSVTKLEI